MIVPCYATARNHAWGNIKLQAANMRTIIILMYFVLVSPTSSWSLASQPRVLSIGGPALGWYWYSLTFVQPIYIIPAYILRTSDKIQVTITTGSDIPWPGPMTLNMDQFLISWRYPGVIYAVLQRYRPTAVRSRCQACCNELLGHAVCYNWLAV